ncbi:MAG: hypothetical protein K6F46_12185 [Desulfovibrio sp.]|nr:hypothetical protein [Desulfovibrio sp.]
MRPVVPREVRDELARAAGWLSRGDAPRALESASRALRALSGRRLTRASRLAVQANVREVIDALASHPRLAPLLTASGRGRGTIPCRPGQETTLASVLLGIARILREEDAALAEVKAAPERKKALIESGLQCLREGQVKTGTDYLRRVTVEFADEPDIFSQMGRLLSAAGLHREAALFHESAMQAHPRASEGYAEAVAAWLKAGEYARAETVFLAILRVFGGHPATFARMAAMYADWGRAAEARDMAGRALAEDPDQPLAATVLAKLDGHAVADAADAEEGESGVQSAPAWGESAP